MGIKGRRLEKITDGEDGGKDGMTDKCKDEWNGQAVKTNALE